MSFPCLVAAILQRPCGQTTLRLVRGRELPSAVGCALATASCGALAEPCRRQRVARPCWLGTWPNFGCDSELVSAGRRLAEPVGGSGRPALLVMNLAVS